MLNFFTKEVPLSPTYFDIIFYDMLLVLAGLIVGSLFVSFVVAYHLKNIYISPHTKGTKLNLMKMKDNKTNEEVIYINPQNFKQSLELFWTLLTWSFLGRKKAVIMQSKFRERLIYITYIVLCIVVTTYMFFEVFYVHDTD